MGTGTTRSILVVDDEISMCEVVEIMLEFSGYKVHIATSGPEALKILEENSIDLVLSDVRMPEMTGIELARKIRQDHPNVPILLMSGYSKVGYSIPASEVPSDAWLEKPFSSQQLLTLCKQHLDHPGTGTMH